jgi:hypothetical protein
MESRLNPFGYDAGDIPSIPAIECSSQLLLTNRMWTEIGTNITEA